MAASSATPRICCVGDLISDVVVQLSRDPQRGTDTPASISVFRGGSAANVAAAVAAAGGRARFVGSVGDDPAGSALIADLEADDVEAMVARVGKSGTIVVLVDADGERSFLTDRGACTELASLPRGVLDDVDLVHFPAYSFVEGPLAETSERLVGMAVERGIPISISTGSVSALTQYGREPFLELLRAIQPAYVIANREECDLLLQGHPWVRGAGATVITSGARATVVRQPNGNEVRVVPPAIDVVDTTGAGDGFAGGFLVARASGLDFAEAVSRGHELAAQTIQSPGAGLDLGS